MQPTDVSAASLPLAYTEHVTTLIWMLGVCCNTQSGSELYNARLYDEDHI